MKKFFFSICLYRNETWTIGAGGKRTIDAFKMKCCSRYKLYAHTDEITTVEILLREEGFHNLWNIIRKWRDL
ncbi:hypothetical protein J437_LFUL010915 [Ladona fulva]|uniref:Uncharacterized protein n=1 Tax=Ladona fulva TaxID=123851 RepID=A0A8K0P2D9_LADFU|nr:hypothetical protein J437_LFUL010915 [Ladona fulva]